MAAVGGTASSGGNAFKTILIGVVTTVVGSAAVYFLGFHSSGNESAKERKEATEKGWATYRENLKIYSNVFKSLDNGSEDINKRKQDAAHEVDVTITSLKNILEDKKIDTRLKNLIELRTASLSDLKTIMNNYFDSIIVFSASNPTDTEGYSFLERIVPKMKADLDDLKKRDSLRMGFYADELKKEYKLADK